MNPARSPLMIRSLLMIQSLLMIRSPLMIRSLLMIVCSSGRIAPPTTHNDGSRSVVSP